MARRAEPWRRGSNGAWYAWIRGKQVRLADPHRTWQDACDRLDALRAGGDAPAPPTSAPTVAAVVGAFLARQEARVASGEIVAGTLEHYVSVLTPAVETMGDRNACTFKPDDAKAWAAGVKSWGAARRRAGIQALRSAFRHAAREGMLPLDPLASLRPPAAPRREFDATADIRGRLASDATDEAWGAFLAACVDSGCRPGEVAAVTAADFDATAGTWTVKNKTHRSTGREFRTVYLTPALIELSKELSRRHPSGPIFRNSFGRPWRRWSWGGRMRRSRQRLGLPKGLVCYSLRHAWATDSCESGVNPVVAAEALGHSVDILARVYSKIAQRRDAIREAVNKVRPGKGEN